MNKLKQIDMQRLILASIPERVFTLDKKGNFSFWSNHSRSYYGYSSKFVVGKKHFSFIFMDKAAARRILNKTRRSGTFEGRELLKKRSGKCFLNRIKIEKFYNEDGRHIGFIGINHDISKEEGLRQKLADSLKKYKDLFENAYDIIYFIDTSGRFLDMNCSAEKLLGTSKKRYIGKKFFSLIHPDSMDIVKKRFKQAIKGKRIEPYLVKIINAKKETKIIEIKPSSITSQDKIIGRFATARDVTDMIEIEQELVNSERRYRGIFENANDVIFFVDKKGKFIDINHRAEEFLGKPKSSVLGKSFSTIIHKDSLKTAKDAFAKGMNGEDVPPYLLKAKSKDGGIRTFEIKSSPLIENGVIAGRFGVARDITDRIKVKEELERRKVQQEAILKNIPDIAWLKDKQSKFLAANEPMAKTLGITPADMVGKTDLDYYPKKLAAMYRSDDREVMRTGKRKRVEEPYIDITGKQAWIETIKTPIMDEKGEILGTTGIARDISDRKAAEEALERSRQKYKDLANSMPQVIFETDLKGKLTFVNEFAFKLFGYSRSDFEKGLSAFTMLAPRERSRAKSRFMDIMAGKEPGQGEYSAIKKDGTLFPVVIHSSPIRHNGKYFGLRGMLIDISGMKEIERALRDSEQRYRVLFEASAEGIIVADVETKRFKYANSTICKMLGYTKSEMLSMGVHDLHSEDDLDYVLKEFAAQAKGEKILATDIPCLRKDGSIIFTDVNAANMVIDGTPCVVGFFSDITQKKALEGERLKLSRLAAIGTLSASIAHEIRNPLFSISTIAQSIKRECQTEQNEEILDAMISEISRLKEFIDDMLFYSKPQTISRKLISPKSIMEEILLTNKQMLSDKEIELKTNDRTKAEKKIMADPAQIKRLFLNLLINAYEASPKGGTISITHTSPRSKDYQGYSISFHNNGKHIDEGNLESIFDLFYSTKSKGCGLGLPTCKKIVEAHFGRIELHSTAEEGTTFTVHF